MKLPEIADRLRELSVELSCTELAGLADEMQRRSPVRRAPNASARMTPQLRADIRRHAHAFPDKTFADIGRVFNVNAGRVSETMAGYRE